MPNPVLNASAYLFVQLHDAVTLRQTLYDQAAQAGLQGTVLLAEEGINLALAGEAAVLRGWLAWLGEDARFAALQAKESWSATPPFRHLRVKVKREIIRMNQPMVQPQAGRAPAVDSATLARWLQQGHCDAGRALALLHTPNHFAADAGALGGAIDWRLGKFSDFPAALQNHGAALRHKTVVSYCTGGIRCEKAALWMAACGISHVLQLDGGILRYFATMAAQQTPGWSGQCVVFDERGTVDTRLAPTHSNQGPVLALEALG